MAHVSSYYSYLSLLENYFSLLERTQEVPRIEQEFLKSIELALNMLKQISASEKADVVLMAAECLKTTVSPIRTPRYATILSFDSQMRLTNILSNVDTITAHYAHSSLKKRSIKASRETDV